MIKLSPLIVVGIMLIFCTKPVLAAPQFTPPGGLPETTLIGKGPDTLGSIRDRAFAAMPRTGGAMQGDINLSGYGLIGVGSASFKNDITVSGRIWGYNGVSAPLYFFNSQTGYLRMEQDNTLTFSKGLTDKLASYRLTKAQWSQLEKLYVGSAMQESAGALFFCTDCKINGKLGVPVVFNGEKWTGMSGEDITQ